MKTLLRLSILSLFCLGALVNMNLAYGSSTDIKLDKSTNTLIAPEASGYTWYLNGTKIDSVSSKIDVSSSGIYQVIMTDENGELKSASISVGVNADGETYRIILIGDSTVQAWGGGYYPQEGWGATLEYFFDDDVTVINRARSARSARSYYYYDSGEEMNWQNTKELIQEGDFVFIGFGINDASTTYDRYTDPFDTNETTGYKWYLKQYIKETQERGGFPVIVTTVRRCAYNDDGTVYDSYHDYPVASREMAEDYDLPCIDLDSASVPLYESMGQYYISHFLHNVYDAGEYSNYPDGKSDMVHFQESGCLEICRLVTEEIKEYTDDTTMNKLIPHIKTQYEVTTSVNLPDFATITRTQSFPEGAPVTIKAMISDTNFVEWKDEDDVTVERSAIYCFTMGAEPLSLTAVVDTNPQPDCNGDLNGFAYIDSCGACVEGESNRLPCDTETAEGIYKITNVNSGYCIQVGDELVQDTCRVEDSQFWEISKDGNYYKIKNYGTGEYMGYSELVSNSQVTMGADEVLWRMEKLGTDTFYLFLVDDIDLKLDISGVKTDPGRTLRIYKRTNLKSQQFALWEADPTNCSGYPCTLFNNTINDELQFAIVPNPAIGNATFILSSIPGNPVSFELYDMQGKRVLLETNITDQQFEFGYDLAKGIYVAKVMSGNNVSTLKFIKY